jgi:hypothetical protein
MYSLHGSARFRPLTSHTTFRARTNLPDQARLTGFRDIGAESEVFVSGAGDGRYSHSILRVLDFGAAGKRRATAMAKQKVEIIV